MAENSDNNEYTPPEDGYSSPAQPSRNVGNQAAFVGRNSDQHSSYSYRGGDVGGGERYNDESTYTYAGGRNLDNSIFSNSFDSDSLIGREIERYETHNHDNDRSDDFRTDSRQERHRSEQDNGRDSDRPRLSVVAAKKQPNARSLRSITSQSGITVIPMTKEQYYDLPEKTTAVTVRPSSPLSATKTSVVAVNERPHGSRNNSKRVIVNTVSPSRSPTRSPTTSPSRNHSSWDYSSKSQPPRRSKKLSTKVITAKKHISDGYQEDAVGSDLVDYCSELRNGPMSIRFLTCMGFIFMVIATIIDRSSAVSYYYGNFSLIYSSITGCVWIIALFIVTLEIPTFHRRPSGLHVAMLRTIPYLRYSWGRGLLYIFVGCLQFCLFTTWNMAAGAIMVLIGLGTIFIGRSAHAKMHKFVRKVGNKSNLDQMFPNYDRNSDGRLGPRGFGVMTSDLNVRLTNDELISVFSVIDRDIDRLIASEDIATWCIRFKSFERRNEGMALSLV